MKTPNFISKGLKTNQSEPKLVLIVAVATIITVFCLVSAKTLFSQASYNRRVVDARRQSLDQLNRNIETSKTLVTQYQIFQTGNPTNIIGGKNSSDPNLQPPDGDNARIVLNALPARYDFPALISSVTKILDSNRAVNQSIEATDDSGSVKSDPQSKPLPQTITLTVSGTASYEAVKSIVRDFERSTRPFYITEIDLRGSDANMAFTLKMNTYFQPALSLELTTKEIK